MCDFRVLERERERERERDKRELLKWLSPVKKRRRIVLFMSSSVGPCGVWVAPPMGI